MRGGNRRPATVAAEMRACGPGDEHNGHAGFRGAGPEERDDPADDRPAKEKIHQEDAHGILLVMPDDGGQEVHEYPEREKRHFSILPRADTLTVCRYLMLRLKGPKCSRKFLGP
jgi:hypothetical protein